MSLIAYVHEGQSLSQTRKNLLSGVEGGHGAGGGALRNVTCSRTSDLSMFTAYEMRTVTANKGQMFAL